MVKIHSWHKFNVDTEENAAKLQKAVVDAAKEITDVVASFGGWKEGGPLLQQSVDFLMEVSQSLSYMYTDFYWKCPCQY